MSLLSKNLNCVLDVKSGTPLIISSGRVLVFNCSLKARHFFCKRKYRLAFPSSRGSFPESTSSKLPVFLHSWKNRDRRKILLETLLGQSLLH